MKKDIILGCPPFGARPLLLNLRIQKNDSIGAIIESEENVLTMQ